MIRPSSPNKQNTVNSYPTIIYHGNSDHTDSNIRMMKSSIFGNPANKPPREKKSCSGVDKPQQEVIATPALHKLPDVSLTVKSKKFTTAQRSYTDFGIYKCATFKVGWSEGLEFYNTDINVKNKVIYGLNHCIMDINNCSSYNSMMPNLTDLLQTVLEESEFTFDKDQIPTLRVRDGKNYLRRETKLFNKHVTSRKLTGRKKYLTRVWNLCTALWGPTDDQFGSRRNNVSEWLKECIADEGIDLHYENEFITIFKLLSSHKIAEACEFANKHNLKRLSLLISQMGSSQKVKYWMRPYTENFAWKDNGVITDDFKKLYLVLCGTPILASINTCRDLDWKRCFGLHLWYIAPVVAPIAVALKLYRKGFDDLQYAAKPTPFYCGTDLNTTEYDLLYHILALYDESSTYQLGNVLHPETHTENIMDYRISWLLLQLFLSLKVGLIRDSEKDHLHTSFSTQLESIGLWKWSIFPLLFLDNTIVKKNLIKKILDRHLSAFGETKQIEYELVTVFKIPSSWIHTTKATKTKLADHYHDYFHHKLHMEDFKDANNTFIEKLMPELFISEEYDYLTKLLEKLDPFADHLINWHVEGGLIREYLELCNITTDTTGESLRFLGARLISIFRRISCFSARTDLQKLFVAEISRRCALFFKLLHQTSDRHLFQNFVNVISRLALPADIRYAVISYHIPRIMNGHIAND